MARTGLHRLGADDIRETVLAVYDGLHATWMRDRSRIDLHRLSEVRYEALVRDPVGTLTRLSAELERGPLQNPSDLRPRTAPARPPLDPTTARVLAARWARWFEAFDYAPP